MCLHSDWNILPYLPVVVAKCPSPFNFKIAFCLALSNSSQCWLHACMHPSIHHPSIHPIHPSIHHPYQRYLSYYTSALFIVSRTKILVKVLPLNAVRWFSLGLVSSMYMQTHSYFLVRTGKSAMHQSFLFFEIKPISSLEHSDAFPLNVGIIKSFGSVFSSVFANAKIMLAKSVIYITIRFL